MCQTQTEETQNNSRAEGPASLLAGVLRWTGWITASCGILLTGLVVLLQLDAVSTYVGRGLATRLSSPTMEISVERVTGSWVRGLRVAGLRISAFPTDVGAAESPGAEGGQPVGGHANGGGGAGWSLTADSAEVGYSLPSLLKKTLNLSRVDVVGLRVLIRSTVGDTLAQGGQEASKPDSVADGGWRVLARSLELRDGEVRFLSGASPADTGEATQSWILDDARLRARDFRLGTGIQIRLDTLDGRLRTPHPGAPPGRLLAVGQLGQDHLRLDTLSLETRESYLAARGTVPLAGPWPPAQGVDVEVVARPLLLRDLGPVLPPAIPDSMSIRVQGSARTREGVVHVDLTGQDPGGGSLNLGAVLAGRDAGESSTISLTLEGLDLEPWGVSETPRPVSLSLEARSDTLGGPWTGEWRGQSPGVDVDGTVSLALGDPLVWEVEGQGAWTPSMGASPLPAVDPNGVALSFRGSGVGTAPGTLQGQGELKLERGTLLEGLVEALTLTGEVASGEARFAVSGQVGGGSLDGDGRITMPGAPSPHGRASFHLRDARYRQISADSLQLDLELRDEKGLFTGHLALPDSARLDLKGSAATGAPGLEVKLDSLRFRYLNLQTLLASADTTGLPTTRLSGSIRGEARQEEQRWMASGMLRVDSSQVGRAQISRGTLDLALDTEGGEVGLDLELGTGGVEGRVEVASREPDLELTVPEIRFWSLDAGAILGREPDRTRLTGTLSGELHGTALPRMSGRVRLALDSATVLGQAISRGGLEAEIRNQQLQADLDMAFSGAALEARGEANLAGPEASYRLRGTLSRGEASGTGVSARFGAEGSGTRPDSLDARAWMVVDSARWKDVPFQEGRMEARMAAGTLYLDTLVLESPAVSVSGGGSLPFRAHGSNPGELSLTGTVDRADLFADLLDAQLLAVGSAHFQAEATGSVPDLTLSGEAQVDALLMDQTRVQGLRLNADAHRSSDGTFDLGHAELLVDRLETPSLSIQRLEGKADLQEEGRHLAVQASALLDEAREGRVSFRVEDLPAPSAVLLESLDFKADEDEWTLQRPARLDLAQGLELDSLVVEAGEQALRARGRVGKDGPLTLAVELQNFRIGTVSDLLGAPELQGRVSGSMNLTGTGREPRMESRLQASLEPREVPPSHVEAQASYGGGILEFRSQARVSEDRGFRVDGSIPLHFSLADSSRGLVEGEALRVNATVDSLPLSMVGLFLPPDAVRNLRGSANGSVGVQGVPEDPALNGNLNLDGVEVGLPALGVRYSDGGGRIRFQEHRILLDSLSLESGGGALTAFGGVTVEAIHEPRFDLELRAREFRAMASSGVNLVVSGDAGVRGTPMEPRISGRMEVLRGDLYLDDLAGDSQVEDVALTEEDYRELARVFGYQQPSAGGDSPQVFQNASLDLEVELRRDSWIRQRANPEMAVQFTGELSLQKAQGDSLRLVGEVSAIPERSYVEQFGRRFSLTQGDLVFQGAPMATQLDLRAEYEVPSRDNPGDPEVTIALDITGTPDDLRLELSSTPPLEASDMVSYLAVGRPADRSLGGGEEGSLSETGGALALGALSGAVEAYAREEIGLDVVEITTDGLEGVTLLAGRYLSPELYLGIRQPVSLQRGSGEASERRPDPEVEVELQAVRWLLLNLQAGGRAGVEFFVRSRIAYE